MSEAAPSTFDEFVESSFRGLDQDTRSQLDLFTSNAADDEARAIWRLMCAAARATIEWFVQGEA